jgi:DNA-binding NarL/FixJ family response regulator
MLERRFWVAGEGLENSVENKVEGQEGPPHRDAQIVIVDDHPIVRHGLARLIGAEPGLHVCGSAANRAEALETVRREKPDLAIVDLSLGSENGLDLVKALKLEWPDLPVLVLSMHDEAYYADRVLRAGAVGFIMKQEPAERMIAAIRQVLAGRIYLSESMAASVLTRLVGRKVVQGGTPVDTLTDRELEVLGWMGKGLGTRQIADKLHLSVKTVENHREHIKAKLKIRTSAELIRYAVRWEIEGGR